MKSVAALGNLVRQPWAGAVLVIIIASAVSLYAWYRAGTPAPFVHDEHAQLLAADTFSHGRLTNPAHPYWQFFDTFHVLQSPTYMSKYPPGPGVFYALGQVLTGHPVAGGIIAGVLSCLCLWYALRAMLSPGWAIAGAMVLAFHPLRVWYESNYFGGTIGLLGATMVLAALLRTSHQRLLDGALAGAGLFLLAATRPYEGLVFALAAAGAWALLLRPRPTPWGRLLVRQAIPCALVLCAGAVWMGYYHWRVTGSITTMPYALHERQYSHTPLFVWQPPVDRQISYTHPRIERFFTDGGQQDDAARSSLGAFASRSVERLRIYGYRVAEGTALLLLALAGIAAMRQDPRVRFAVLTTVLMLAGMLLEFWQWAPHYFSPAVGLAALAMAAGAALIGSWQPRGLPVGKVLAASLMAALVARSVTYDVNTMRMYNGFKGSRMTAGKAAIAAQGGRHLVFVHDLPEHSMDDEWVYNSADIDAQQVVMARDMGPENAKLLAYYPDRQAWMLELGKGTASLRAYPTPPTPQQGDQ